MTESTTYKNKLILIMLSIGLVLPTLLQSILNLGVYKQLIIGTIVNASLFATSKYVNDTKKIIALSTLPSVSSILSGLLFSGLTYYSKLMLPFIWLGNFSLVYLLKKYDKKIFIAMISKISIIYVGFRLVNIIFKFPNSVFNLMNVSMGITQIYTICLGLVVFLLIVSVFKKLNN